MFKKRILIFIFVVTVCFQATVSFCQTETNYLEKALEEDRTPIDISSPLGLIPVLIRIGLSLFLVVGLILLLAVLLKKLSSYGQVPGSQKLVKVIDTAYIAPRKMIYIVDVAGEILVLAMDVNTVRFLTKIENEQVKEKIMFYAKTAESRKGFQGDFKSFLKDFEKGKKIDIESNDNDDRGKEKNKVPEMNNSINAIHSQINKLREMKKNFKRKSS